MWSTQKILNLIEDLRCSPCLWDMRHSDYRNRSVKAETYEAIARKYNVNTIEVAKKIQVLRTQFRREHKKVESLKNSGAYDPKAAQWFGYESLLFLLQGNSRFSDCDVDDQSEDQIFVSLSDCESSYTPDLRLIKSEIVLENNQNNENETNFEDSTCKNIEVSIVEDTPDNRESRFVKTRKLDVSRVAWNRDEFSVYGEHIANKLRNCGRSQLEVAVAQHEIDNICFKLTMGAYKAQLESESIGLVTVDMNDENSDVNVTSATVPE